MGESGRLCASPRQQPCEAASQPQPGNSVLPRCPAETRFATRSQCVLWSERKPTSESTTTNSATTTRVGSTAPVGLPWCNRADASAKIPAAPWHCAVPVGERREWRRCFRSLGVCLASCFSTHHGQCSSSSASKRACFATRIAHGECCRCLIAHCRPVARLQLHPAPSRRCLLRPCRLLVGRPRLLTQPTVVMGANGKVGDVLNIDRVVRDNVAVIKRFTGGGTVALGKDAVLTSIISSRVSLLA